MEFGLDFLALEPSRLQSFLATAKKIESVRGITDAEPMKPLSIMRPEPSAEDPTASAVVAIVPVRGEIVPSGSRWMEVFGWTGLNLLKARMESVRNEPSVRAVVLDFDSPGGSVYGVAEMAEYLREYPKPIHAIVNHMAASAAYWLASQAATISMSPSGLTASVGVIWHHEDLTGLMEKEGVKVTVVTAGRRKAELSQFAPLSDEGRAVAQERLNEWYRMFVNDVAAGRGVTPAKVREDYGEGAPMQAREALKAGVVDYIETPDEALANIARKRKAGRAAPVAQDPTPAPVAKEEPVAAAPVVAPVKGLYPDVARRRLDLLG